MEERGSRGKEEEKRIGNLESMTMMIMEKEEETRSANVAKVKEKENPVDIYLCAKREDGQCDWYVIEIDNNDTRFESLSPVFSDVQPNHSMVLKSTTCVAVGHVFYVLGAHKISDDCKISVSDPTRDVYCIDTLHPELGWTSCPSMIMSRISPEVFTLDGKIYVLGGFYIPPADGGWADDGDDLEYFAEVFDPLEWCWRPALSKIPDDFRGLYIDAHQLQETDSGAWVLLVRMVDGLGLTQTLYRYNFRDQSWSPYAYDFGPYRFQSLVFVHDILYSYRNYRGWKHPKPYKVAPESILCFDSTRPDAKPKELTFLEKDLDLLPQNDNDLGMYPAVNFHHLCGTNFCLLWEEDYNMISCVKFTVCMVPKPSSSGEEEEEVDFVASHVAKSTYKVNDAYLISSIAIPSFRRQRKAHDGEEGTRCNCDSINRIKRKR